MEILTLILKVCAILGLFALMFLPLHDVPRGMMTAGMRDSPSRLSPRWYGLASFSSFRGIGSCTP